MKRDEAEIWCPTCREVMGKVIATQQSDDHWTHVTQPHTLGKWCHRCSTILERKRG